MIVTNKPICKIYDMNPLRMIHSSELKFSDKAVLGDIITAFNEGLPYFKSNKCIAKLFGSSKRTIIRSINRLEKKNWIKIGTAKDLKNINLRNSQTRVITAINVKKIFGQPYEIINGKEENFIKYNELSKWIKNNRGAKMTLVNPLYTTNGMTNSQKLVSKSHQPLVPKWHPSNIKHHSNIKKSNINSNKRLHVQSSKSKSKNSNKDYDDSLASNKVHSKAGFTMINSKKAGAQAHLARRGSSKHSSRFSNSKYSAIDSLLHDAFPNFDELVTRKSYERKCISSWLNGNKKLNTPSFSMSEIENAIDKAKKYNKQPRRPVLNPLALVFDILQTSRKEESDTKVNQKKYQNKKSKANNASSKSSNSSTNLDESDPMEAAEIRDLSKDDNSDHEIAIYYQTIIKGLNNVLNPYFEEMADKYSSIKAWDKRDKLDKYIKKHVRTMSAFLYAYNQFDNFSLSACEKQKKDPVKVTEKMFVKE